GLEREIRVEFDIDRVAAYNIPFSRIIEAVERGNINLPGGSLDIGTGKYLLRVPGDFQSPLEIQNLVVFVRDGKPVYLRDVARIIDGFKERTSYSRFNNKE
ncbi:MAG: hypothetical protein GTN81_04945, partial [Proteobacteria bacterium]|nr:hypothetical protein [Pseudomonadota bacterium]